MANTIMTRDELQALSNLLLALSTADEARVNIISSLSGNTRFADAQMRFPHEADDFGARDYTVEAMYSDLMRISRGRANQALIRTLCENARETADWLTGLGLEWEAGYPHTAGYRRSAYSPQAERKPPQGRSGARRRKMFDLPASTPPASVR